MNETKRERAAQREKEIRRLVARIAGDMDRLRELVDFLLEVTSATIDAGADVDEAIPVFIRQQGARVRALEAEIVALQAELSRRPPVVVPGVETPTSRDLPDPG